MLLNCHSRHGGHNHFEVAPVFARPRIAGSGPWTGTSPDLSVSPESYDHVEDPAFVSTVKIHIAPRSTGNHPALHQRLGRWRGPNFVSSPEMVFPKFKPDQTLFLQDLGTPSECCFPSLRDQVMSPERIGNLTKIIGINSDRNECKNIFFWPGIILGNLRHEGEWSRLVHLSSNVGAENWANNNLPCISEKNPPKM